MLTILVLNSLSFILWDYSHRLPGGEEDIVDEILKGLNIMFAALFFIEFLIKVTAMGFAFEKYTYMTEPWNVGAFVLLINR